MESDTQKAEKSPAIPAKRAHALVDELAQLSVQWLRASMEKMFSACDDFFFDRASRAKSNQDQNLYFESLREVRLKKLPVVRDFTAAVEASFAQIQQRTAVTQKRGTRDDDRTADELELVGQEQMEKDVVVTDMVSKARIEWQQELFQLRERMLQICPPFEEHDSPFDPGRIAAAFARAADAVDVELKILKSLYRQFDRTVLHNIDELYDQANQHLVAAGVLPQLTPLSRRRIKKEAPAPQKPAAPAPGSTDTQFAGIAIPESDKEMLELARVLKRLHDGGMRLSLVPNLEPETTGKPMPRDELLGLLSDVQLQPTVDADGTPVPVDIRHAIDSIVASRGHLSVGAADEDIINIVAMFFDIVLDDRNLPIEIQALVSRLQLPVLKVALKDRSFFTDRKHPARQLINEIARTSIGWDASDKDEQDALFIRLTELVEQVLHASGAEDKVFEQCLDELLGFIEKQDQRAIKREKRISEQAAAQARTEASREAVKTLLNQRLADTELPEEISNFLVEDWQQVLFLHHVRHGEESPEWREAVQTLDDLIWSVQPHTETTAHERLLELLPDLQARLSAGIESAESVGVHAAEVLDQIRAVHAKLSAGKVEDVAPAPLSEKQKEEIDPARARVRKPWHEMTAVERQMVKQQELLSEQLIKADVMEVGTWLEYDDLRRGTTRRCKLSAKLLATETFIFVNRLGAKVFEKPRKAFAYDLQKGYARVLDATPFFDRTLERITSNLRQMIGEQVPGSG